MSVFQEIKMQKLPGTLQWKVQLISKYNKSIHQLMTVYKLFGTLQRKTNKIKRVCPLTSLSPISLDTLATGVSRSLSMVSPWQPLPHRASSPSTDTGGWTPHLSQQAIASSIHASSSISRDHSVQPTHTITTPFATCDIRLIHCRTQQTAFIRIHHWPINKFMILK